MTEEDWQTAADRAVLYARALRLPPVQGLEFALEALRRAKANFVEDPSLSPTAEIMRLLYELVAERLPDHEVASTGSERSRLSSMPHLNRGSMVPEEMSRGQGMAPERFRQSWEKAAFWRRSLFLFLVLLPAFAAGGCMIRLLPPRGWLGLEPVLVFLFMVLFAWISIGFWSSVFGFFILVRRYDRYAITGSADKEIEPISPNARIAVLVTIRDEEVDRVFGGLHATYQSLKQSGELERFDFFVLSDTSNPDTWIEEEAAWSELCRSVDGFERVFYRRRRVNLKRKSGNIADFCRRWGRNYRYMVVFDADSVMAGQTLLQMLRLMERHPAIGILQTATQTINRETLFARMQQFANRVYGPLFMAGLHFWQLGEGQYWGHNALIRIEPFMRHCALPRLPGNPPLGGEILSHDFVEAALMRRAGLEVWLAHDLGGSYEEMPPNLLAELKRDRRWCQGNMQHLRLLFTRGIFPAHRALFLNGAMSYLSALLWFFFLTVSTVAAVVEALFEPDYFPSEFSLFPEWPVWDQWLALMLLIATAVILFLPKLLGILFVFHRRKGRGFGGAGTLILGVLSETLLSALLAPIRMVFHSKFVFMTLLGKQIVWEPQFRGERKIGWLEAIRFHGLGVILGLIWGIGVFLVNPSFFWWLTPVLVALVLAVPTSVYSSRARLGRAFRKIGLFLIPEEIEPPRELLRLKSYLKQAMSSPLPLGIDRGEGFLRAVVDPYINVLHLSLLRGERRLSVTIAASRRRLQEKALTQGPGRLTRSEKEVLLSDAACMRTLHLAVWSLRDEVLAKRWGLTPS